MLFLYNLYDLEYSHRIFKISSRIADAYKGEKQIDVSYNSCIYSSVLSLLQAIMKGYKGTDSDNGEQDKFLGYMAPSLDEVDFSILLNYQN